MIGYYVGLVVLGAIFIVNLFLAVIFEAFMKNQQGDVVVSEKLAPPAGVEWFVYPHHGQHDLDVRRVLRRVS